MFTIHLNGIVMMLLLCMIWMGCCWASPNTIDVTLLSPFVETFNASEAIFGSYIERTPVVLPVQYGGYSCTGFPVGTSFANTIALIKRGECSFLYKAYFAEVAGAEYVVIFNNVSNSSTFVLGADVTDPIFNWVTAEVAFITYEAGMTILDAIQTQTAAPTMNLTGSNATASPVPAHNVMLSIARKAGGQGGTFAPSVPRENITFAPNGSPMLNAVSYDTVGIVFAVAIASCAAYWAGRWTYYKKLSMVRSSALRRLKKSKWDPEGDVQAFSSGTCSVCLVDFQPGADILVMPPCKHVFHNNCVSQWLSRNNTCPNCKVQLLPPEINNADGTGQQVGHWLDNNSPPPPMDNEDESGLDRFMRNIFTCKASTAVLICIICIFAGLLSSSLIVLVQSLT